MNTFDTFLPSGAIEQRRPFVFPPGAMASPDSHIPRSVPPNHFPNFPPRRGYSSSPHTIGTPISPPKTRSGSADDDSAALIEDWRAFTTKIREQAKGERAHLIADRARADEVMEEERQLWQQERSILKARIEQLETELAAKNGGITSTVKPKSSLRMEAANASGSTSNNVSPAGSIPQESGRNPDGTPFYAPAPTNPSRSFNPENQELRIDSITGPRETPIRVTSKALRPVDFGIQSPERQAVQDNISGIIGESIDISLIQPTLEGVPIKTSAVDPIFAATVLSPHASASPSQRSPTTLSPDVPSPPGTVRRIRAVLEVQAAPENRRLTLHAGHTPNHSITKFDLGEESGNATPTQSVIGEHIHHTSMATERPEIDQSEEYQHLDDEDPELHGPLGFTSDVNSPQNEDFARELVKRLSEEAMLQTLKNDDETESILDSEELDRVPESLDSSRKESNAGDGDIATCTSPPIDGLPRLRMKPSANFGKPFGQL